MGIDSEGPTPPAGILTPKQVKAFQNVEPKALGVSFTFNTTTNLMLNAGKSAQEYLFIPVISHEPLSCTFFYNMKN